METVGRFIVTVLDHIKDEAVIEKIRKEVEDFARSFPLFTW